MLFKKSIKVPIYDCSVDLILTDFPDDYIKKLYKIEGMEHDGSSYHGICLVGRKRNRYYVVVDFSRDFFNTVAHELRHCVDFILTDRGFALKETDEAAAYLAGYLMSEVMKFVTNKNVPIQ